MSLEENWCVSYLWCLLLLLIVTSRAQIKGCHWGNCLHCLWLCLVALQLQSILYISICQGFSIFMESKNICFRFKWTPLSELFLYISMYSRGDQRAKLHWLDPQTTYWEPLAYAVQSGKTCHTTQDNLCKNHKMSLKIVVFLLTLIICNFKCRYHRGKKVGSSRKRRFKDFKWY